MGTSAKKRLTGRGGPGRGQGRKSLEPDAKLVQRSVGLTRAQWDRFYEKGGAAWLRKLLDRCG